MARAIANCKCVKCGKSFQRTAYLYNRRDADDWKSKAEAGYDLCTECWKAEKRAAEKAEAEKAAKEVSAKLKLPDLVGSEKQVSWANDIRATLIKKCLDRGLSEQGFVAVEEYLAVQTDAVWWIDNRTISIYSFSDVVLEMWHTIHPS